MWIPWRTIRYVWLCSVGLTVFSGCVPLIGIETFPQRAMRLLNVVDAGTREPIESAMVRYRLIEWHNWMAPVTRSGWLAERPWPTYPSHPETAWTAESVAAGTYALSATNRCTVHWLTVPTVLGCWLHETYIGVVEVSATGYDGVWFTDSGRGDPAVKDNTRDQQIEVGPRLTRVILKRAAAAESSMDHDNVPDGVRYETKVTGPDGGTERQTHVP